MGIGFMIKGPLAIIVPILVIGGFILTLRDWGKFYQLRLGYGVVILTVIIFPWFYKMLALHGDEFKSHILGAEIRDRVIHNTPFSFYYFWVPIRYNLPWSLFFISAFIVKLRIYFFIIHQKAKNFVPRNNSERQPRFSANDSLDSSALNTIHIVSYRA